MKISGTIDAYITPYSNSTLSEIQNGTFKISDISYCINDMQSAGWTKVGTANLEIELLDINAIILGKAEGLKMEIRQIQANAEVKINGLREKLGQLLAITDQSNAEPEIPAELAEGEIILAEASDIWPDEPIIDIPDVTDTDSEGGVE